MTTQTIKLLKESDATITDAAGLTQAVLDILTGDSQYYSITYNFEASADDIRAALSNFDDFTVRESVSGGCYGARDGKIYEGFTVYMHIKNFADRFVDSEGDEIVNPWHLAPDYGTWALNDLDDATADALIDSYEALGLTVKHDNTYNFNGHSKDEPTFLVHFDFKVITNETQDYGPCFILAKFHEGGDIRGNYGAWHLIKFESQDDVCGFLYPSSHKE